MTIGVTGSGGISCQQCGNPGQPADQFCKTCGTQLAAPTGPPLTKSTQWWQNSTGTNTGPGAKPINAPWAGPSNSSSTGHHAVPATGPVSTTGPVAASPAWRAGGVDGTTRYLCAAAHLDPTYARAVIGEYLIESTRAVPPSPGIDAAAVLRDAVAARCRGKIRDGVLLALVLLALFTATTLTVVWFVIGVIVAAVTAGVSARNRTWVLVGVFAFAVVGLMMVLSGGSLLIGLLLLEGSSTLGATFLGAIALALAVFLVLAVDETIVDHLTRDRFRRSVFQADGRSTVGWERTARTLGLAGFARQLDRVATATKPRPASTGAELVVHRGWVPFVGSGVLLTDYTLSLPLERAEPNRVPQPFTAAELDAAIREAMQELRSSASLSPGRRLTQMDVHEQVFLPADELGHLAGTPLADVLTDPRNPPADRVPIDRARALADAPVEVGRYYISFRVEAWNRDVVTSCFLTTATDQRTLYLEWSNCVLLPLKSKYRDIDRPPEVVSGLRAMLAAVTLPATLPSRIGNLLHFYRRIPAHPQEIVAERHGAGRSLRELAADDIAHNFFQDADALRYLKLVEQGLFRAIGQFLEARGYSISEVLRAARTRISNTINIHGSSIINSAIGIGHTEQTTTPPPSSSTATPPR